MKAYIVSAAFTIHDFIEKLFLFRLFSNYTYIQLTGEVIVVS